jgi:hypothetical protein
MNKIFYTIAALALTITTASARNITAPLSLNCDDSLECRKSGGDFKYWEGLDFGVNGYLTPANSLVVPSGSPFLELDYARSHSVAWNMGQYNLKIVKNYVQVVTGIGLEWNSYAFRNNWSLEADSPTVTATETNIDYSKNKLRTTWINVPLLLEFNTNKDEDKSLHIAVGVTGGYNIFRNRLKQEYEIDGIESKRKLKDDFNVNPFRYAATARIGYGDFSIFANYQINELFKENRGPALYPFSAGFGLNF